jgi:hypothetical protein
MKEEIKDIQYFIKKEKEYISEHKNDGTIFVEGTGPIDDDFYNPEYFLKDGKIQWYYDGIKGYIENEEKYELTEAERVILRMFYGDMSCYFRDDYYHGTIPEVARELFKVLNSLVLKAPQSESSTLRRYCVPQDKTDFSKGDIFTIAHCLTCTKDNWGQEDRKNVYIIEPLKDGKTKAHNLYEIYNHGDEKQVNFTRGTSFKITKVITQKNDLKLIYMKELP